MTPFNYPATPPPLPHSTSSPVLTSSPNTRSPAQSTKNYHPYRIQTTSSSLLTRSNSSPTQPISQLGHHRPSRSMSSLSQAVGSEQEMQESPKTKPIIQDSSPRPGMRRSGTLPAFPAMTEQSETEVDIPVSPSLMSRVFESYSGVRLLVQSQAMVP